MTWTEPTLFDPPAQRHSETSLEAAQAVKEHRTKLKDRVYAAIALDGPVTDEEIAEITGLNPSTARPRRVELLHQGAIAEHPFKGLTKAGRRAARWYVRD